MSPGAAAPKADCSIAALCHPLLKDRNEKVNTMCSGDGKWHVLLHAHEEKGTRAHNTGGPHQLRFVFRRFAKLRKATIGFVMFICPIVLLNRKTRLSKDGRSLRET